MGTRRWSYRCVIRGMDNITDREKDSCAQCRWVELFPGPYGDAEYYCEKRQEPLSSTLLTKTRCPSFAR